MDFFVVIIYLLLSWAADLADFWFSFDVKLSADSVKTVGCVISCCASAHTDCSSCFCLTFRSNLSRHVYEISQIANFLFDCLIPVRTNPGSSVPTRVSVVLFYCCLTGWRPNQLNGHCLVEIWRVFSCLSFLVYWLYLGDAAVGLSHLCSPVKPSEGSGVADCVSCVGAGFPVSYTSLSFQLSLGLQQW